MNQLRIYTLASKEAATKYISQHWPKHLTSLPKYGFQVNGVWQGVTAATEHQVFALVAFDDTADVAGLTQQYMSSVEFKADMAGFSMSDIIGVESVLLRPASFLA